MNNREQVVALAYDTACKTIRHITGDLYEHNQECAMRFAEETVPKEPPMPTELVHCKLTHPHNVPDGSMPCTCVSVCDEAWSVAPHTGEPTKWMRIRDRVFHEDGTPARPAPIVPTERGAENPAGTIGYIDESGGVRQEYSELRAENLRLRAQLTTLQSSRDVAERDAERYQYLRDKSADPSILFLNGDEMDAAIDAARVAPPSTNAGPS